MLHNRLILNFLCLCISLFFFKSHGQTQQIDSLFIDSEESGQVYIHYKVSKKQTLYHISKCFHVPIESLYAINEGMLNSGLLESQFIKIPIHLKVSEIEESLSSNKAQALYYKVQPGENLFHLAKRKFKLNIKKIKNLNEITGNDLNTGQILIMGFYPVSQALSFFPPDKPLAPTEQDSINQFIPRIREFEVFNKSGKGVAVSLHNALGTNRLFALHNTASLDSQIEIVNPISNRKVYAKVIGKIPPIYESDIQLIVSAEVAKLLGAVDKRFFISLRYR